MNQSRSASNSPPPIPPSDSDMYAIPIPLGSTPFPPASSSSASTTPRAPASPTERFSEAEEQRLVSLAATHKRSGNSLFSTNHHRPAIDAYKVALASTPIYLSHEIAILQSNIAACHLKLCNPEAALTHADLAVQGRPKWGKAWLRRVKAREACGGWKELETALKELDELEKSDVELTEAEKKEVIRLKRTIRERVDDVKKKEVGEVVESLKTLGNSILSPFGMSTNDFAMVQDARTGQYSMTFQRGGGGGGGG